jgi:integrase
MTSLISTNLALQTREYIAAAKAPNTSRAYRADWEDFESWCAAAARSSLPASPDTVALYITDRASSLRPSTLERRRITINKVHQAANHPAPATSADLIVSETLKGIRRTKGTAPEQKKPLLTADISRLSFPDTLAGIRDRSIILLGFAGGLRRSELTSLDMSDLAAHEQGVVLTLRRSKTDQEGAGRQVAIPAGSEPTCPVAALVKWIERSEINIGFLFRSIDRHGNLGSSLSSAAVSEIVKCAASQLGLDPDEFGGHSLRAGLCTQAYINGARELDIMRQTGHRSVDTLRRYVRDGVLFRNNVAGVVGL